MKDDLGTRMKEYESVSKNFLTRRVPVIIRVDGKAFHTFTKGFVKPFDVVLMKTMQDTMKYLCENIQGCVLGYCQSDEITLVLTDYADIGTCAWFDYNVQKICSVVSSMATLEFNKKFSMPFGSIFFALLAFPLSLIFGKKDGLTLGLIFGIIISVLYWAASILGQLFGVKSGWNGFLMMWIPNFAIGIGGILLYLRLRRK